MYANVSNRIDCSVICAEELALAGFLQSTDGETACELCGDSYPHPVTYHMRVVHPGCGNHAGGKGYNSSGNFCVGWAGNCGDGGVGMYFILLEINYIYV